MKAFLDRPLEGDWPHLWIDATCVKVRQADRIVSVAVGVNADGRRQVLGVDKAIKTSRHDEGSPHLQQSWRADFRSGASALGYD